MSPFAQDPELTPVNMDYYNKSFVLSRPNQDRLRIQYYLRKRDGHLLGEIHAGEFAAGPPDHLHGGATAAILDDSMGVMSWFNRHPVVTANLNVSYKKPLPLGRDLVIETWIEKIEGRKVFAQGELRVDGEVHVMGQGLFIKIPLEQIGANLDVVKAHYGL